MHVITVNSDLLIKGSLMQLIVPIYSLECASLIFKQ